MIPQIYTFDLSEEVNSLWIDNDKTKYILLEKELQFSEELVSFVNRYQKDRFIVDEIYNLSIEKRNNEIYIDYTKNMFSGCRDLDVHDDDQLDVTFTIDTEQSEITVTGPPVPEERSTYEEF